MKIALNYFSTTHWATILFLQPHPYAVFVERVHGRITAIQDEYSLTGLDRFTAYYTVFQLSLADTSKETSHGLHRELRPWALSPVAPRHSWFPCNIRRRLCLDHRSSLPSPSRHTAFKIGSKAPSHRSSDNIVRHHSLYALKAFIGVSTYPSVFSCLGFLSFFSPCPSLLRFLCGLIIVAFSSSRM